MSYDKTNMGRNWDLDRRRVQVPWIAVPENRTTMWSNTVALLKGNLQVRVQWRI